jgi:hypothetical protein
MFNNAFAFQIQMNLKKTTAFQPKKHVLSGKKNPSFTCRSKTKFVRRLQQKAEILECFNGLKKVFISFEKKMGSNLSYDEISRTKLRVPKLQPTVLKLK